RGPVLWAVAASAVSWLIFTIIAGAVSDRIGRRKTYILGWVLLLIGIVSLFPLVNTGSVGMLLLGLVVLTVGLGFTYGQQPAMYAELFPSSVRFSGVSVSYAIGSILGGAFAPTIAKGLVSSTGTTASVAVYLGVVAVLALAATLLLRDRTGIPLGPDHEDEQSVSPIVGVGSDRRTTESSTEAALHD
ncbi:MAG TPA: MFS transporter, partial [Brevibacterium linens]|nr:MFS transporter [Brevibacterium linens]